MSTFQNVKFKKKKTELRDESFLNKRVIFKTETAFQSETLRVACPFGEARLGEN